MCLKPVELLSVVITGRLLSKGKDLCSYFGRSRCFDRVLGGIKHNEGGAAWLWKEKKVNKAGSLPQQLSLLGSDRDRLRLPGIAQIVC